MENPTQSLFWSLPVVASLMDRWKLRTVDLDMSGYDLMAPDGRYLRKRVRLAVSAAEFLQLEVGSPPDRHYVPAEEKRLMLHGRWYQRSALAAVYPPAFCRKYSEILGKLYRRSSRAGGARSAAVRGTVSAWS